MLDGRSSLNADAIATIPPSRCPQLQSLLPIFDLFTRMIYQIPDHG
jgi:hypothetical protein